MAVLTILYRNGDKQRVWNLNLFASYTTFVVLIACITLYIAMPHITLAKHSVSITCGSHLISYESCAMLMDMAADRCIIIFFPEIFSSQKYCHLQ